MGEQERAYSKSIGAYLLTEVNTKQKWVDDRPIYRKVIAIGSMPNATTKNVAHGITFASDTAILSCSGHCADGTNWLPLPYVDVTTGNLIEVRTNNTNVIIVSAADFSSYTTSYVTLEYVK